MNIIEDTRSEDLKLQGNEEYKKKNYRQAIELYSQSVALNSDNLHSVLNRAQCHLLLKEYQQCIDDCNVVLTVDNNNFKAVYRRAKALMLIGGIQNIQIAIQDFQRVLETDSGSDQIRQDLNEAIQRLEVMHSLQKKQRNYNDIENNEQKQESQLEDFLRFDQKIQNIQQEKLKELLEQEQLQLDRDQQGLAQDQQAWLEQLIEHEIKVLTILTYSGFRGNQTIDNNLVHSF